MRKSILFIILLAIPLFLSAQWYGDGKTPGTAYYGIISGSYPMQEWNTTNYPPADYPDGVIYVGRPTSGQNDLEVGTGGALVISSGIKVKFCTTLSDLRITGSGSLSVSGNSTSSVLFTKNDQASWGHIAFDDPSGSGSSSLTYCIIEYGSVTGSGYTGAGGGILIRNSNVNIANSIIRNNSSDWGGGIFIDDGEHPSITRCLFLNNTTIHGGGGIYCWNGVTSTIENCIFDGNKCTEPSVSYYTGGGVTAQTNCAIKIINCTFVNNTSTRPEGQSLMIHASANSRVINSVFWGAPSKQIYCFNTSAAVIINCAYRGITFSSGTPVNSIVLNSVNDAADGPNFNATDGSDWSIKFLSPCRDAGVNSYSGIPIPSTDFIGKSTIVIKDMGAYEVQYSYWNGITNTNWTTSTNWEAGIDPSTGTGDVIIPSGLSNYPVSVSNPAFTIGSGKQMILNPGAKVTLSSLTNNGTLKLGSDASNISSLIISSYSGNNAIVELYLTGGGGSAYKWHYISSPISALPVSTFILKPTMDFAQYFEARPSTNPLQGWIGFDGYIYYGGGFLSGLPYDIRGTNLIVGKGYNYYYSSNQKLSLPASLT